MSNSEKLYLELGDIIQIESEKNENYHNKIFLIDYIDGNYIRLLDTETFTISDLHIEDNNITDESIEQINILSKTDKQGYTRLYGLLINTWVNIYFGGDVPTTITGEIVNHEEDAIEIRLWPSNDVIFIDFAYRGIPLDLPIQKIEVREKPKEIIEEDLAEKQNVESDKVIYTTKEDVENVIKNVLIEGDAIIFGEDIDRIEMEVEVSKQEKRFALEEQTNDLLDEMLSTIPNIERTRRVMNQLHKSIERFKELREMFSKFDIHENIIGKNIKGKNYKPIVEKLLHMTDQIHWLLPVVEQKTILYPNEEIDIEDETLDFKTAVNNEINRNMEQMYIQYKNGEFQTENNYDHYIQSMDSLLNPYEKQISTRDELLYTGEVHSTFTVVINNVVSKMQEFYSSIIKNNLIKQQRFVMSKYGLGITRPNYDNVKYLENKNYVDLFDNETIAVKSFLKLPRPYIELSKMYLPSTSIYDKTNLNNSKINYWQTLRKSLSITTNEITNINKDKIDISNFWSSFNHIVLDESIVQEDKYKKFLEIIIPTSSVFFDMVKEYITDKASYKSVLQSLELFHINQNDITIDQYKNIVHFIEDNLKNLKQHIATMDEKTNQIRNIKVDIDFISSILYEIIGIENKDVQQKYTLSDKELPSEQYSKMMKLDFLNYYTTLLSYKDISLLSSNNINEQLDELLESKQRQPPTRNTCKNYVLTKKYISLEELKEDDGKREVYYDKKYDDTDYLLLDEYKSEFNSMDRPDFLQFLIHIVEEKNGLSQENAVKMATTIINGKKQVEEGQYALLELLDDDLKQFYYVRKNNEWILDDKVTKEAVGDVQSVFCNIQKSCIQVNEECIDNNSLKNLVIKNNLSNMAKKIYEDNEITKETIRETILFNMKYYEELLNRLYLLSNSKKLKRNHMLYTIGTDVTNSDIILSPHSELRDMILSDSDIIRKFNRILLFIEKFTRNAVEENNESTWWYYCSETNTKLLPTFFYDIAMSYIHHNNLQETLAKICAERGEISDDGDKWVDKYSGYTITMIDYDNESSYDEKGYKLITFAVLDREPVEFDEEENKNTILHSEESLTVKKIIRAITYYLGINLEPYYTFIIKNVLDYTMKQIPSKDDYMKKKTYAERKGKKMLSYEIKLDQLLLFFTGIYILIVIQTSIPTIKTKKTFPGCAKSFTGYPLYDNDYSGLEYIVCVMKKISSSQSPWNAIKGLNEKSIKNNLQIIYDKLLIKDGEIQNKIKEKQSYLQNEEHETISLENQLLQWTTFIPALNKIKLQKPTTITKEFRNELLSHIKNGSMKQFTMMNIVYGKINSFGLEIQNEINKIVAKEEPLLQTMGGEPFLENVCCHDREKINTSYYFQDKNKTITHNNKYIVDLHILLQNTKQLSKSSILYSNENTKLNYPDLIVDFNEETIYRAFIKFCKINKGIPIPDHLKLICSSNESEFEMDDTIDEKVTKMKEEGRHYDHNAMRQLLNIMNKHNSIVLDIHKHYENKLQLLFKTLMESDKNEIVSEFCIQLLRVVNEYDTTKEIPKEPLRELRNYILENEIKMKNEIKEFIIYHGNMKKSLQKQIIDFIDNGTTFHMHTSSTLLSGNENTLLQKYKFIQNTIENITMIYPIVLQKNITYNNIPIPKHWNLSKLHASDIVTFVKANYQPLSPFYEKKMLFDYLFTVTEKTNIINKILNTLPFQMHIEKNKKIRQALFNHEFVNELVDYLFILSLKSYITIVNSEMDDYDILQKKKDVANLLIAYIQMIQKEKSKINYSQQDIIEFVLRTKEREKNIKTRQYKELTDEERRVEKEKEKAKLGQFNIGLQKALTQYVKSAYDMERLQLEQDAIIEQKLGLPTDIASMNADIYKMEFLQNQILDQEIDNEEADLSQLPDDDNIEDDSFGDEQYY